MNSFITNIFKKLFVQLFLFHAVLAPALIVDAQTLGQKNEQKEIYPSGDSLLLASGERETQPRVTVSSGKQPTKRKSAGDDNSTLLIGTGVAVGLAVLVGLAANSSNSDDGGSSDTYYFKSPIRIGDDTNYNGNHKDNFQINKPSGTSYSESFKLSSVVGSSKLQYTIAGAHVAAKVFMNGTLVGRTCNPGNTADAIKDCDPIDVTTNLKAGSNVLKISCVLYPGDEVSPYDDIEIYNMRLEMTK